MKCSYLSMGHVYVCTASKGIYTPSPFELQEFCLNGKCKTCSRPALSMFGIVHAYDEDPKIRKIAQLEAA
jgi:hypothetical protein